MELVAEVIRIYGCDTMTVAKLEATRRNHIIQNSSSAVAFCLLKTANI